MSGSTPADLAVTFRSLDRRQREAIGDADPGALGGLVGELQGHVAAAAAVLGTAPDAAGVAAAIERRRPDEWDDATLETLRGEAIAAGAVLRRIAAAAEAAQDR
ncbi:MAG TPA: hypothetical protein VFT09_07180 [Ilumatobacteraceae bacterium]|nr:hypothetical protein [Ilumatobacteraceae bacterium]